VLQQLILNTRLKKLDDDDDSTRKKRELERNKEEKEKEDGICGRNTIRRGM
jgi:hypothetical protein